MSPKQSGDPQLHPECLACLAEQSVVVGLSGGRDSVALLLLLHDAGVPLLACHVHHGIRGAQADADAAFCEQLCRRLGVPLRCVYIDAPALAREQHLSLETAARLARRRAFAEAACAAGTKLVALAHHEDDRAETALFNLARGAAGPRSMAPVHQAEGLIWLRPLLDCSRAQITRMLQQRGCPWCEDATNAIPDVSRNIIRHEVIPALDKALGRRTAPIIARSAAVQQSTAEALEEALSLLPLTDPQGRLFLPGLETRSRAFVLAVLRHYLLTCGVPDPSLATAERVADILPPTAPNSRCPLPGGYLALRRQKRLIVLPPGAK
ncbi:MAG: tRNA lysidine(34) synthetase TilS [Akkermansia sp.]